MTDPTAPSDERIEAAAKAMWDEYQAAASQGDPDFSEAVWDEQSASERAEWRNVARAALVTAPLPEPEYQWGVRYAPTHDEPSTLYAEAAEAARKWDSDAPEPPPGTVIVGHDHKGIVVTVERDDGGSWYLTGATRPHNYEWVTLTFIPFPYVVMVPAPEKGTTE